MWKPLLFVVKVNLQYQLTHAVNHFQYTTYLNMWERGYTLTRVKLTKRINLLKLVELGSCVELLELC